MAKKKRKRNVELEKKTNKNLLYAAIAVVAVIIIALIWSFSGSSPAVPEEKIPPSGKPFIIPGAPGTYEPGKVRIIEYFKFNCDHCYDLNQRIPELEEKYGDQLEITYKPMLWLTNANDQPFRKSNEAYIIAERMGKGKEMKNSLFDALKDGKNISDMAVLEDIARSVGLGDDFSTALENGDAKDEAQEYINEAQPLVFYTPTVIINGNIKVDTSTRSVDQMVDILDTIIDELLT
jgi:predicted DsbA family dithiol-disulfide isomerase